MLFSLLIIKHYLDLYITDTALKVSRSLYCFTTPISHAVENYLPRLWGKGISDAIILLQYCDNILQLTSRMSFHITVGKCKILETNPNFISIQ